MNTGVSRAWEFLRRNPTYIDAADEAPPALHEPAPFPFQVQTDADRKAAAWGLLTWQDPRTGSVPASPFWTEGPSLAAAPAPGAAPLAETFGAPEWRLSGLRLADGTVVLIVERGAASVQLRIDDGRRFDPDGGLEVRLPVEPDLRAALLQGADIWPIVAVDSKKAAGASRTASFSSCSTESWAARAVAA